MHDNKSEVRSQLMIRPTTVLSATVFDESTRCATGCVIPTIVASAWHVIVGLQKAIFKLLHTNEPVSLPLLYNDQSW